QIPFCTSITYVYISGRTFLHNIRVLWQEISLDSHLLNRFFNYGKRERQIIRRSLYVDQVFRKTTVL
ncbi:MAG: hypothetical protein LUF92_06100, partial [Clostridiales bacterium]|nr:hypothetical protein [Clostridiales bacterium]